MHRFGAAAAAFGLIILLGASASASTKHPAHHRCRISDVSPSLDMYSRRVFRRMKTLLQLKLLQLRKEHLDRVRQVIEKRLPVDTLFGHD